MKKKNHIYALEVETATVTREVLFATSQNAIAGFYDLLDDLLDSSGVNTVVITVGNPVRSATFGQRKLTIVEREIN